MQHDPAMRDCGGNRSTVLLGAAASISKLRVDDRDRQPPGMIGLYRVGDLKQFLLGGLGRRERALILEFHLGSMIAMPMASAGCFSPLGPLDIIFLLFLCAPILCF